MDEVEGADHVDAQQDPGERGEDAGDEGDAGGQFHSRDDRGRDVRLRHTHPGELLAHAGHAEGEGLLPAVGDKDDPDADAGQQDGRVPEGLHPPHGSMPSAALVMRQPIGRMARLYRGGANFCATTPVRMSRELYSMYLLMCMLSWVVRASSSGVTGWR